MLKTIYKYQLDHVYSQALHLRRNSKLLNVAYQNNHLFVWAEFDPNEIEIELVNFYIRGTGMEYPVIDVTEYLGTVHNEIEDTVWHVFFEAK